MIAQEKKLTGSQLVRKMQLVMVMTTFIGAPIVQIFMVYIAGGGASSLKANWLTFGEILAISVGVVVVAVLLHAAYIKFVLQEAAAFLDNDQPRKGESTERYYRRISGAINCTLNFPIRGAGLSLFTYPATILPVLSSVYWFFFKFPIVWVTALLIGGICVGVLVANVQFYVFRKRIQPAQKQMLSLYPTYWQDTALQEIHPGLKQKMTVSLVSLMFMIVLMAAIFNNLDASKGFLFSWGQFQKSRISRELKLTGATIAENATPEERAAFIKSLDDNSGGEFFLMDKNGATLFPEKPESTVKAVLSGVVRKSYKITEGSALIVPFPYDEDILMSVEDGYLGANARVGIPGTNLFIVARVSYRQQFYLVKRMYVGSTVVLVLAMLISIFFARVSSGDVTEPMEEILQSVKKISSGDLLGDVKLVTHDELGVLAFNFKGMVVNLSAMILKIIDSSTDVDAATSKIVEGFSRVSDGSRIQSKAVDATSSSMQQMNGSIKGIGENIEVLVDATQESSASIMEMSTTIKEVADSVDQLNRSMEETSSSISEMTSSIKQVAEHIESLSRKAEGTVSSVTQMEASIKEVQAGAKETAKMSEEVASNAERGKEQVQSTIEGIGRARKSSEHAVNVIQGLAGRVEEIGAIITVINDITDQTNLLALNAAIIAAQAGEHGRGFAVVADEIKRLAERTAYSTGEINHIIKAVQHEAKDAVEAVGVGYKVIEEGVELSQKAGEALDKILDSARTSVVRVQEIAEATVEQAERTREVLKFFEEISNNINQLEVATQEQSNGSVLIMKSAEQIREITRRVNNATQEQYQGSKQIIKAIENINEIISSINKNQSEQIENTGRVVESIADIRKIAGQNEKDAEEMFQASANLSNLAEGLRTMVEAFKVNDTNVKAA